MQLTDTQKLDFIKEGNDICPICSDSSIERAEPDFGDLNVSQECQCSHCFAEWQSDYALAAIKLLGPGKLNIKALSPLQEDRYMNHAQACVICQYDNFDGTGLGLNCDEFITSGTKGHMDVSCPCCNASWRDQFILEDITIIDAGKYAPVVGDSE